VIAVSAPIRQALARCGVRDVEVVPAFSREFIQPGTPPDGLAGLRAKAAALYCAMTAPRREYAQDVLLRAFAAVRMRLADAALALYGPGSDSGRGAGVHRVCELHRAQGPAVLA